MEENTFENKQEEKLITDKAVKDAPYMVEMESTPRGRALSELIYRFTNDFRIGKRIKSGELRKKMDEIEPEWNVPDEYNMTHIDLEQFSMKFLSPKKNPNLNKVVLQLHGGGYVAKIRNAYYTLAVYYSERSRNGCVLTPDYRVAPEDPYPAALEDAVTAYEWLLQRGYSGEQIVVAGDSAGGGLAMALTMYLRDHHMPLPCGIIAMSPWTDVSASGESYETNYEIDPLFGNTKESLIYLSDYAGEHDKTDPYISPAYGDFSDFPPMLIQVGSLEMLLSDSLTVTEKARAKGRKVRLTVYEDMFHVFQLSGMLIPESKKAWNEVEKFFEIIMDDEIV